MGPDRRDAAKLCDWINHQAERDPNKPTSGQINSTRSVINISLVPRILETFIPTPTFAFPRAERASYQPYRTLVSAVLRVNPGRDRSAPPFR
ncbi:hypothetical protein N7490_011953 [Penicillium lividum]|nr:hypothetical protein N7490_011953 [Penicillium lividum]